MTLLSLQNLSSPELHIGHWIVESGQHWCLLGTTGSGKSRLARLLEEPGELRDHCHQCVFPPLCLCVGFEAQQARLEAELYDDDTDFLDRIDQGHTGMELLQESGADREMIEEMVERFGIGPLLEKGFRVLSSGETRKLLIAQALLARPDLLILDEPFDSLDSSSSQALAAFLASVKEEQPLLLCVNRLQDIQPWNTHLAVLHRGELILQGERGRVLEDGAVRPLFHFASGKPLELPLPITASITFDPLLSLENSRVYYGETVQFQHLHWVLRPGEHTIISGPNGAGKSTLLQLISGDHPQCFNNGVTVFGHRRGSGESIWDIKKHLGLVSGSLHQDYRVQGNVLTVVASGLSDSIGLYRQVSRKEKQLSRQWLAMVGLEVKATVSFRQLSWGEQRLVLIARALIKHPPLLLLDEPTLGLDDRNRFMVLACLERIAGLGASTMLFVSHREDEHLPLFRHQLLFTPAAEVCFVVSPHSVA